MTALIVLTGQRFGRLVITTRAPKTSRATLWNAVCDCGREVMANANNLRAGTQTSCGCWTREKRTKHGMKDSRIFGVWSSMLSRCTNPNRKEFPQYGGRGISVCERWMEFANFYADMGDRPEGKSLDRIDNDKGYEPNNCRWATSKEQSCNKQNTRWLSFGGETLPLPIWAERYHLERTTLSCRLDRGWPMERALTAPVRSWGRA